MRSKLIAATVLVVVFLSACGGGTNRPAVPGGTVPPVVSTVASISITPGSTLLARLDDTHQLSTELLDANGAVVDKPVTWISSDTNIVTVDEQGLLTSMGTVGSAMVSAEVDGIESDPVLVTVVLPVLNTVFINDDQVVGDPEQIDPGSSFAVGAQYRVTLTGVDAPDVGTVLLAREELPIAGGVVAVEQSGGNIVVTLEVLPIGQLFSSLKIDEVFVPTEDDIEISAAAAEFYTMERQTDGSYLFTLLPDVPVAEPVGSSALAGSSQQKVTPVPVSAGHGGAIGTAANPQHPFDCTFTGPSFDGANGNQVLTIAGMSPSIALEEDLSLPFVYDSDNGGLQKIALEGRVKGTFTVRNKLSVQLEGKASCKLKLGELRVPMPGALALVLGGQIPMGIGFELGGKLTLADMGFGVTGSAEMRTSFGITCPNGMGCEFDDPQFTPTGEAKPVFDFPPGFSNPAADFKFEPAIQTFGYADFQFGHPFFSSWRLTLAELQAGVKLGANLALVETQIDDGGYSSDYKLSAEFVAKPGGDLANLLTLLGMSQMNALTITGSNNLITSPAAEVPVAAPTTKLITADVTDYTVGDVVTFTVKLDPTTINFLPFIYNVNEVMIYRDNDLIAGVTDPTRIARTAANDGQTEFTIDWVATESGSIGNNFHAFVSTDLLPLPYFGELELGKVAPPPSRSKIVFMCGSPDGSNWDICTANDDGSGLVSLTQNVSDDRYPVWSPDRSRIAFQSGSAIYVMDPDGSNLLNLTPNLASTRPAWSPDGSKIAFQGYPADSFGQADIYTMSTDGSSQINLTRNGDPQVDEAYPDQKPAWSQDGTMLIFESHRLSNGDTEREIYRMNSDGSGQVNLTNSPSFEFAYEWSPDGSKILYSASSVDPMNANGIYVMNTDGSNKIQLDSGSNGVWSPDGRKIAYTGSGSDSRGDIYVMDSDGTNSVNLTNSPGEDNKPKWSSDGLKIVFSTSRDSDNGIYVMNADGSNQVRVAQGIFFEWSPN